MEGENPSSPFVAAPLEVGISHARSVAGGPLLGCPKNIGTGLATWQSTVASLLDTA